MANQKLLRLSSTLTLVGVVLVTIIVEFLHPGGGTTYAGTLAIWATSWDWTAIHLGQFVGMAGIGAGLLVLFFALGLSQGAPRWVGFFGALAAGVSIALAAVTFAVDGVANKMAANAWASAPAAEQATRFASAQALRWLEIGTTGFTSATFLPTTAGYTLLGASMIWLYIVAWLGKESVQAVPA